MRLPSIDAPSQPVECSECGEPIHIVDPPFCGACESRLHTERIIESGNDYREQAQARLELQFNAEMDAVKARTRAHLQRIKELDDEAEEYLRRSDPA